MIPFNLRNVQNIKFASPQIVVPLLPQKITHRPPHVTGHLEVSLSKDVPVFISSDHLNGTDRLAEVAATLDCDLVVNVQADEPLIEPSMIDSAVAACANQDNVQMSTLRCQLQGPDDLDDPHVVKVAVDHAGYALFFSRAAIGRDRSGAPPADAVGKHIGLFFSRASGDRFSDE